MRKKQLWLCYCMLLHLPGLELWTLCSWTLPHRCVDRMGIINTACRNGMLPKKRGVLKKITKRRWSQRVLEMPGLESAWSGTARDPEGIFLHSRKGRPATVTFPRGLWVMSGDVPNCRQAAAVSSRVDGRRWPGSSTHGLSLTLPSETLSGD